MTSNYSRQQEKELKKLKPQKGIFGMTAALAGAWGMSHSAVHAKWHAMHKGDKNKRKNGKYGGVSKTSTKVVSAPVVAPVGIKAMRFEAVDGFTPKSKIDPTEQAQLEAGLDSIVPLMVNKRGFKVPKRFMARAKAYLEAKYNKNKFNFSTGKAVPEGFMIITKH